MKIKKGKTKLRFKKASGDNYQDWKEKKLGDIGENIIGLTYSPKDVTNDGSGTIVLRSSNIKDDRLVLDDIVRVDVKLKDKLKVQKNDILICTRNGSQKLIGKNILLNVENSEQFTFGAFMSIFRSPINEFLSHLLKTDSFKDQVQMNLGARINQITTAHLNKFSFTIPSDEEEQQKIASFLSAIDEKISIIEKELEELKAYKKGVMQALFAIDAMATERRSDGATERRLKIWDRQGTKKYSFLRFKDDDGNDYPAWEIKKLGDVTKIYDGTHMTPSYQEKGVSFYSVEHVTANDFSVTKFISREVYDKENKRVKLEKGDILMTRIGDIGTSKYIHWDVEASFYVSLALIKNNSSISNLYLDQYIKSAGFQHELHKRTIHVAFPKKINLGEIGECMIEIPVLEEQEKIANFLSAIDDKINLVIEQQQQTQQFKKGLLQQMFN